MSRDILWLDDRRDPMDHIKDIRKHRSLLGCIGLKKRIVWVKNIWEFHGYIISHDLPSEVWFDHDLHESHYTPEELWNDYHASKKWQEYKRYERRSDKKPFPTGEDAAKLLATICINNAMADYRLPKCFVHSANPVGAEWIKEALGTARPKCGPAFIRRVHLTNKTK